MGCILESKKALTGDDGMTENKCRDCACFHGSTDFCTVKREKVDYLDNACEYFIWD